ncbi:hypothetical protein [Bradyrhizobium japonicum]|uniref:hypothetical protein n=1 Tax=Bradyrhizobium japonicum TaxID=375 RepID=UPI0011DE1729|nr:hypothetical protein [Bradyrhizobium japonicum]MCD9110538.1 hypothetical protein [Bradyrhizobium japonicum]MCD9822948.1 hypothetical protein [Bradyrhizobium japonicum]MCD9895202.1 hypothetical protein [Bradyrhizobium japonicum]MEB2671003.1 hypothetical protein [Bradyrhizobium japonicum]WRI81118.1 hypothetical protein R3F76_03530 [Bradyrhizobium japonicum]
MTSSIGNGEVDSSILSGSTSLSPVCWAFLESGALRADEYECRKACGPEFGAGIKHLVEKGWLELHESGTYVRILASGDLLPG